MQRFVTVGQSQRECAPSLTARAARVRGPLLMARIASPKFFLIDQIEWVRRPVGTESKQILEHEDSIHWLLQLRQTQCILVESENSVSYVIITRCQASFQSA